MTRVAFLTVFAVFAGGAAAVAFLRRLILDLKQELLTMSDALTTKIDAVLAAEKAMEERVNTKLAAVETARDAAVAELTTTKAALADAQAQLAALPHDTSDQEAALQAQIDRLDGVITALNAVDAAPVEAGATDTDIPDATVTPAT